MKKSFTKLFLALLAGGMAFSANAADYISAPMSVSPANNSILGGMGDITISWNNVSFALADTEYGVKNNIDLSNVTVILNGEENTAWRNYMGAEFYASHLQGSNEQSGGGVYDAGYAMNLYLGSMSFFWSGEVNITIAEGVITTTTGEINPEINLTYYIKSLTEFNSAQFSPVSGSEFNQGEGEVTVTWTVPGDLTFNPNARHQISVVLYDEDGEAPVETYAMDKYCEIVDNSLVVDLSSLEPGFYSLTIPEGKIFIGQDYMNFESMDYEFTIIGETTGISSIDNESGNCVVYNLQGNVVAKGNRNLVNSLGKGLYIINGKKVVIK